MGNVIYAAFKEKSPKAPILSCGGCPTKNRSALSDCSSSIL